MAKKQSPEAEQPKSAEGATETKEAKPDAKEGKPEAKEPKKPKAPKAPKAAPDQPPAEGAEPAKAETPAAPKAPKAAAEPGKKKKRAGVAPARGKKLRNHLKNTYQKIAKEGAVPLAKAVTMLKQAIESRSALRKSNAKKVDETVEIHMSLGVDATQSEQLIRGTVPLPHGVGKKVRVVVFCQGDNVGKATAAGADFAGSDDLIEKIQKQNWLDFDVALATQDLMGKVSRLGKTLGPRGLMPTPKAGTVITGDVAQAVKDFKAGKVEFRTDKGGNVHAGVGKMSFEEDKIAANVMSFVEAIRAAKPSGIKGNYVKSITLSSTMGPGIKLAM
ncbi:MAG: 50S ribosomal protein L1 [Planctomycetes bacterium]|nr:50S ribosomal protein L1 [Planctomycetota bacterium]